MVRLFLTPPPLGNSGDTDAVKEILALLEKLESIIWAAMVSGDRFEARLWICRTISCIHSITPQEQCELFIELLRLKKSKHDVAVQLLQMIFENRPEKVGSIIAKKSCMLEKFFEGRLSHLYSRLAIAFVLYYYYFYYHIWHYMLYLSFMLSPHGFKITA